MPRNPQVEAICSVPVELSKRFALFAQFGPSQCADKRMPTFSIRPRYRLASYSGIPSPSNALESPPSVPPTPIPASVAMTGPATRNGTRPGIASAPVPANQPSVPPITAPEPAPVAALQALLTPSPSQDPLCQDFPEAGRKRLCRGTPPLSKLRTRIHSLPDADKFQRLQYFSQPSLPPPCRVSLFAVRP